MNVKRNDLPIEVAIAFSNKLFSVGVCKLLENIEEIEILGVIDIGTDALNRLNKISPQVLLLDFTALYNDFAGLEKNSGINVLLFDTCCGEDNLTHAVVTRKVSGIILNDSSIELLVRAIQSVAKGEVWLDKTTVKNLLSGINSIKTSEERAILTKREKEIVSFVGKGYKNKEIARKLFISEPTVKTHLHRIFQKLDVRNRPQLITYALKNPEISGLTLN